MPRDQKQVSGSRRTPLRNAKAVGKVDPKQRIEVTVRVRSCTADAEWDARVKEMSSKHPSERTYLSREDLAAHRGADPDDLAKIDAFAHAHHLTVVETSVPKRTVRLAGTIAELSKAFGVQLQMYKSKEVAYRGRTGPVHVPNELAKVVEGVFGLDNRPFARPHYRQLATALGPKAVTSTHKAAGKSKTQKGTGSKFARNAAGTFSVPEVGELYNFPSDLNGTGQCIAIIELNAIDQRGNITGTGYTIADLEAFFKKLGKPMPDISAIGVDGGANTPGSGQIGDAEVTADIDVAGAIAPKAKIAVYFAPDTDAGFIDVVNTALHDTVRKPSVISISWGGPEDGATDQFLKGLNQVLQDAAAMGVTVCCETGDYGSSDELAQSRDGQPHVEFPASSPFALACGGTKLTSSGKTISNEVVWNDGDSIGAGGGGVSNKFPRPKYQATTKIPLSPQGNRGRGLPDVAGNATGYRIIVGGKEIPVNGTSAVAPLWAGLIALINQSLTEKGGNPVGFLNPLIYGPPGSGAFNDVVEGNNDIDASLKKYSAKRGWDACTGIGSPNGTELMRILQPRR
jgi:kumamolisin